MRRGRGDRAASAALACALAFFLFPGVARAGLLPPLPLPGPLGGSPPPPASATPGGRPSVPPSTPCSGRHGRLGDILRGHAAFPCDFPDPMVLRVRGGWYAYGTSTGWDRREHVMPVLFSRDLRSWRWTGDVFRRRPRWSSGDVWAPSVTRHRGRYLLYYSALRRRDKLHCLAVASARRARGPFRDHGPLSCRSARTEGHIDPAPVTGPRGRRYLFFSVDGPRHSIAAVRLRADGLRARSRPRILVRTNRSWHHGLMTRTVEAPFVVRRGRRWLLFYSAGCWCRDYRMGLATASHPLGPYREAPRNPFLRTGRGLYAPGGGSVTPGPDGKPWLAFHAWSDAVGYERGGERTLRLVPLRFRGRRVHISLRAPH